MNAQKIDDSFKDSLNILEKRLIDGINIRSDFRTFILLLFRIINMNNYYIVIIINQIINPFFSLFHLFIDSIEPTSDLKIALTWFEFVQVSCFFVANINIMIVFCLIT